MHSLEVTIFGAVGTGIGSKDPDLVWSELFGICDWHVTSV
jgi:hypothetical protein